MISLSKLSAKIIEDSRGDETVEVSVQLSDGSKGKASVPQGKGKGKYQASYVSPKRALKNIEKLNGQDLRFNNQKELDNLLDKKLGANVTLGVSFAIARAMARSQNVPLWEYIGNIIPSLRGEKRRNDFSVIASDPESISGERGNLKLYVNMIEGGVHAKSKLPIQEYLVVFQEKTITDSLLLANKFYKQLKKELQKQYGSKVESGDEGGFVIPEKDELRPLALLDNVRLLNNYLISYGIDVAANNIKKNTRQLSALYKKMIANYPLTYIEDPYSENSFKSFADLVKKYGDSVLIVGDDLTVTNPSRVKKAYLAKSINAVIIKPNQIGTLTEALEVVSVARKWKWKIIVSHRSGETKDDFIADFAWAVGADGVKFGAPKQPERMVKYKRLEKLKAMSF